VRRKRKENEHLSWRQAAQRRMEVETMLKFYYIVVKGATLRQGGKSKEWFGGTQHQPLSLMEETRM